MVSGNPAFSMDTGEMETITANARKAVVCILTRLQSTLISGDSQEVRLAQQTLDLAVSNYAVAGETLEKVRRGESVSDFIMPACNDIADEVVNICNLIGAGNLESAQLAYETSSSIYSSLPPPANAAQIPAGLADLEVQIMAATAEAATILSGAGREGKGAIETLETKPASPI